MKKKEKPPMKVHHILADGREVDSVEGYIVHLDQVPQFKRLLIKLITEGKI